MRRLVREASDGEAAHVDVPAVLAQMRGEAFPLPPANAEKTPARADLPMETAGVQSDLIPEVEDAPTDSVAVFKIETIRVEPQKLDALMTLAGEMAVSLHK